MCTIRCLKFVINTHTWTPICANWATKLFLASPGPCVCSNKHQAVQAAMPLASPRLKANSSAVFAVSSSPSPILLLNERCEPLGMPTINTSYRIHFESTGVYQCSQKRRFTPINHYHSFPAFTALINVWESFYIIVTKSSYTCKWTYWTNLFSGITLTELFRKRLVKLHVGMYTTHLHLHRYYPTTLYFENAVCAHLH